MPESARRTSVPEEDTPASRALASYMRAELSAPVEAVGGFIDLVAEDAERLGLHGYTSDIGKMQAARQRLSRLIDALVAKDAAEVLGGDVEAASAKLRHDLRTPMAAVLGYAELMAEEAQESAETDAAQATIGETLQGLLGATRRLLAQVDVLVERLREQADEPQGTPAASPASAPQGSAFARDFASARDAAQQAIRSVLFRPIETQPALAGRIVIVDDDQTNLDLLSRRLSRDGHAVESIGSGAAALRWIAANPVDLVLLDLIMPDINGIDVLERLRAQEATRLIPIIIISGLDEADGAIRCIEAGADDYLAKPVDAVLLRARINAALERKRLRDSEVAIARRLEAERERSEALLRNMLPASVVGRLRGGETTIADEFPDATILFCDLVGFTAMAAAHSPSDTLDLLNAIFSAFDGLAAEAGIEKIKTIGDAYMAAGGLPTARGDHAEAVAAMAMRMPDAVARIARDLGTSLTVRIGLDTGPVIAGIIGTDKFLYDVWGDTVNTASRMEHHGVPGRIHITEATRRALGDRYTYEARAPLEVKGKGVMQTYLIG